MSRLTEIREAFRARRDYYLRHAEIRYLVGGAAAACVLFLRQLREVDQLSSIRERVLAEYPASSSLELRLAEEGYLLRGAACLREEIREHLRCAKSHRLGADMHHFWASRIRAAAAGVEFLRQLREADQ